MAVRMKKVTARMQHHDLAKADASEHGSPPTYFTRFPSAV
jgi:hypothetical protein